MGVRRRRRQLFSGLLDGLASRRRHQPIEIAMTIRQRFGMTARDRRGSALILVLIMTLSLAGLAMSAIYLSSSAGLLSRYYDRERNYRYAAEAAIALGKSRAQMGDTTMHLLDSGATSLLTAAS